jgi:phospholipase C
MPKINHFIVLMLENRAFDHIFGFSKPAAGQTIDNLLTLNPKPSNLLDPSHPAGGNNPTFATAQPAPFAVHDKEGPSHSFNAVNVQLSGDSKGPSTTLPAKNNGFAKSYASDLSRRMRTVDQAHIEEVMQCFSASQLPAINQLAAEFCLCDKWHCEVPGPTMPNRMFIHAATSEGYVHNDFKRPYLSKTVYELFEEKGLSWAVYFHDLNEAIQFTNLKKTPEHFRRFESWAADVAAGNLPEYTFIFPRFLNDSSNHAAVRYANSQHAPEDVRHAEHLIADVYDALAGNYDLFKESALVVTYDEHGGFYDHVIPPAAPNPDEQNSPNPDDHANYKPPVFNFDRLGLRVPTLIVSPWIKKGTVEHRLLQHTSVIKTVNELFSLNGPLNKRDASAGSFADLFDQLAAPRARTDMPAKLTRPDLQDAVESVVAGIDVPPGNEPLDSLTEEWVQGTLALLKLQSPPAPGLEAVEVAPQNQGEASAAIQRGLATLGL